VVGTVWLTVVVVKYGIILSMGEEHQDAESLTVARAEERKKTGRQVGTSKHLIQYCVGWES